MSIQVLHYEFSVHLHWRKKTQTEWTLPAESVQCSPKAWWEMTSSRTNIGKSPSAPPGKSWNVETSGSTVFIWFTNHRNSQTVWKENPPSATCSISVIMVPLHLKNIYILGEPTLIIFQDASWLNCNYFNNYLSIFWKKKRERMLLKLMFRRLKCQDFP